MSESNGHVLEILRRFRSFQHIGLEGEYMILNLRVTSRTRYMQDRIGFHRVSEGVTLPAPDVYNHSNDQSSALFNQSVSGAYDIRAKHTLGLPLGIINCLQNALQARVLSCYTRGICHKRWYDHVIQRLP